MKALVLAGGNIKFMPYLFYYFKQLSELNYDITLFYWNRNGLIDSALPSYVKPIEFTVIMKSEIAKYKKLINFIKYRKEAINVIKSDKYDRIVVCNTQFSVLLSDVLIKFYKNKYVFDYRDPSYENIKWYKNRVAKIVNNSIATFISSKAYHVNLPNCEKIHFFHNISMRDLKYRDLRKSLSRKNSKIRISFWGCIRDLKTNLTFISDIANDERFELNFYGTIENTANEIVKFCRDNNIQNVYIHKEYLPEEKYQFVQSTDIIHNLYNNSNQYHYSMGNKFYDGIIFYIPQICNESGIMGSEVEKYKIGITVNPYKPFADKLYEYYNNIDWLEFEKNCDECLNAILIEQNSSNEMLKKVL